ncbi:uncharacterized protein LOC125647798 isoform X2 [Ostrea edulis]|uniref:uncharacterized protein LOC125647798 isoform X2 n=1 Tax=Ostrea edulis TaxID=37623 RepID=UPI0024AEED3A|nr:uncharacterized protein LOC125647798 isoform X2 [Ostrea edulis]
MLSVKLNRVFRASQRVCTKYVKRNLSTCHFFKHEFMYQKALKSSRKFVSGPRRSAPINCQCVSSFLFTTHSLHTHHGDCRDIVDLVECGGNPLPSELGLCTYTPSGAYLYLLETIHESLAIDWQLSIVLSSMLIRLMLILLMKNSIWEKRGEFTLRILNYSQLVVNEKKLAGKDYQDMQKLKNSSYNNGPGLAFYFFIRQQISESITTLQDLMGKSYILPTYGQEYVPLCIAMFLLIISPSVTHRLQSGTIFSKEEIPVFVFIVFLFVVIPMVPTYWLPVLGYIVVFSPKSFKLYLVKNVTFSNQLYQMLDHLFIPEPVGKL